MKKITLSILAVLILSCFLVVAQTQSGSTRGMGYGPYTASTETTVSGTVEAVQLHPGQRGGTGTHLLLKTKDATLDVHVGPTWYLEKQGISFKEGDEVEVLGSLVKSKDALLARTIKKGGTAVTLRDSSGRPLWAGKNRQS